MHVSAEMYKKKENEQFSKVSKSIFVQYYINKIHNGKGSMPTVMIRLLPVLFLDDQMNVKLT